MLFPRIAVVALLMMSPFSSAAEAHPWIGPVPNAVRAFEHEKQLVLIREKMTRRWRSLKHIDDGTSEEGDEDTDEDGTSEEENGTTAGEETPEEAAKLRAEVAALKKELTRKKGGGEAAPEEPHPKAMEETFATTKPKATKTAGKAKMPYFGGEIGSLTPFGREDVGRELTERSIMESDRMVDQIEKAEVAEEKRAVYRALTRLRGSAINSFDGVAHSQVGNINEFSATNNFRDAHPVKHLANEEKDVAAWAFPDPPASESDPIQGLLQIPDDV